MRPLRSAHLVDHFGDRFRIREVDAEIMRRAPGCLHGVDGALGGLRSLQACKFLFDQRGSCPLAAGLYAREQVAFEILFVGCEAGKVRIRGIGLWH